MRKIASILGMFVALAVASPAGAASNDLALATFPPAGRLDYKVLRDGDDVGSQSVEFIRRDDQLIVKTRVNIVVTLLGIPIYRFTHSAEEQWQNGQLVHFASQSDDDGEPRDVVLDLVGDRLKGIYNRRTLDYPADMVLASLWHPDTVRRTVLLDPIKGRERQVTVTDKGEETVQIKGQSISAHRYALRGQVERDVWYGPDGQVVQVRFPAKDESEIEVVLR